MDYFPHVCNHGQTMFIVEQRFGNDGYAFWFKLLETLGSTDGHFLDCGNPAAWEFLIAKTRLSEDSCTGILDLLAKLGAIDPTLWAQRIIWCQNFVDGIAPAYTKRGAETPPKPELLDQKPRRKGVSGTRNPQTRLDKTREEEKDIESSSTPVDPLSPDAIADEWNVICGETLPRIAKLTPKRRTHVKARLREAGRDLDWWQAYFRRIIASPFLIGENDRGWKADFDWATGSEDNVTKVLEGRYDRKRPAPSPASPADKPRQASRAAIPNVAELLAQDEEVQG